MGNAPTLKNNKFYLSASNNFQSIINFIRKQLKYQASDNLVSQIILSTSLSNQK